MRSRLKRGNAEAHVNLGNLLKDLGKFHDAEDNYRVAIQLKPSSLRHTET